MYNKQLDTLRETYSLSTSSRHDTWEMLFRKYTVSRNTKGGFKERMRAYLCGAIEDYGGTPAASNNINTLWEQYLTLVKADFSTLPTTGKLSDRKRALIGLGGS